MPVKKRPAKRRHFDEYRREQLIDGPDAALLAGVGYLEPARASTWAALTPAERGDALDAMREDWARHGAEIIADAKDCVPWALAQFGEIT